MRKLNVVARLIVAIPFVLVSVSGAAWAQQPGAERPSGADEAVVTRLHRAHKEEIAMGQVAEARGQRPKVKDFAAMLIRDHNAADARLLAYADGKRMDRVAIERAADPSGERPVPLNELLLCPDDAFDATFASRQVAKHQADIDLARTSEAVVSDPALASLIAQTLPILNAHLSDARELTGAIPEPRPRVVHLPGDFPGASRTQSGADEQRGMTTVSVPTPQP